jgi:hypothetical protein
MLVPVIEIQGCCSCPNPFAARTSVPQRSYIRFQTTVTRRALAAGLIDALSELIEIGDRNDPISARQRAHGIGVHIRTLRKVGGPEVAAALKRHWIVALDPAVITAVSNVQPVKPHDPLSRANTDHHVTGIRRQVN